MVEYYIILIVLICITIGLFLYLELAYKKKRKGYKYYVSYIEKKYIISGSKRWVESEYHVDIIDQAPVEFINKMNKESKSYYRDKDYVSPKYILIYKDKIDKQ